MPVTIPSRKLKSAEEMQAAIAEIVDTHRLHAAQRQYDTKVCILAVAKAGDVVNTIPVEGDPGSYGQAVLEALGGAWENYFDHDGEYTSGQSSIGAVRMDVSILLDNQKSNESD